jgi:glycosyltransferase involved in cell wall biosynthesis
VDLWYVEDKLSPELPELFYEWLGTRITRIFLPEKQKIKSWQKDMNVVRYSGQLIKDINLDENFLNSLDLSNKVIAECELSNEKNKVDKEIYLFVNNGNVAISHFLIQNSLCKHPMLSHLKIIVIQANNVQREMNYKFPNYWVNKKNEASIFAAHVVVTWDKDLYQSLDDRQTVLLLDQKSGSFEHIIEWINMEVPLDSNKFPFVQEMQAESNYDILNKDDGAKNLISVIIPFYNMGPLLLETIQSIRESTYQHVEIIVVNDGSDDEQSIDILKLIHDTMGDILIINIHNQGLANARNVGAKAAKGKYISFLDADDLVNPIYYERCIKILEQYINVSFVYSWVLFFGLKEETWVTFDAEFPLLLLTNMLSAFPVIRRKSFLNFGLNKIVMDKGMEDYESWISLMENGCRGISIPEPLVFYRIRADSMSRKFTRESINILYFKISNLHSGLYKKYGDEIFKLVYFNGPGYLWNNPAVSYSELTYGNLEESPLDNNQIKYELLRLANSKVGKVLLRLIFKLKLNKLFR